MALFRYKALSTHRRNARRPDGSRQRRRSDRAPAGPGLPAGRGALRRAKAAADSACSRAAASRELIAGAAPGAVHPAAGDAARRRASRSIARWRSCWNCRKTRRRAQGDRPHPRRGARRRAAVGRARAAARPVLAPVREPGARRRSGGSLHDTLQRLADYLERSRELRGRVVNALIYPAILLVMVALSLLFLLGYVVPQFAAMFDSLDARAALVHAAGAAASACSCATGGSCCWRCRRSALVARPQAPRPGARARASTTGCCGSASSAPLVAKLDTARLARTLGTLLRQRRAVADRAGHRPQRAGQPRAGRRRRSRRRTR